MSKKICSLFLVLILFATLAVSTAMAESTPAWMPEWDREADVVVVGCGPAGAMAAKAALDNGATTLILEKESKEKAGGSAAISKGFLSSPYTAEMVMNNSVGRVTMETAQKIADKANAAEKWLREDGEMAMNGQTAVGYGTGFYAALMRNVEALGIEVLYETRGEELVYDPMNKEVYGVKCTNAAGETVYVKANKGVILCTGGYVANENLMTRFHFAEMPPIMNVCDPNQTGDGLLMALELGAALDGISNQQIEWYNVTYKKASEEMGTGILHMTSGMTPDARIFVNTKGERFMNENQRLAHTKCQLSMFDYDGHFPNMNGYENLPMYTIFDSTLFDGDAVGPHDYWCGYASLRGIYNWSADNKAELEKGWLVKADTIEELVTKLAEQSGNAPIDVENLKKTIAAYNAACDNGVDEEFGRESFYLAKLENPPYYAAEIAPSTIYTIGGLSGGQNGETLDWKGNPIPRLYHAGDIGQPNKLSIAGLQGAMALGEIAGEDCSQLASH